MTGWTKHSQQACAWNKPKPHRDASLRYMMHGPVQSMDYERAGFAVGLLGYALSPLRGLRRVASLSRGRR